MRYRRYSKAQLNAISRSYTATANRDARAWLQERGIDFHEYCVRFGWKGSAVMLQRSVMNQSKKVMANLEKMNG